MTFWQFVNLHWEAISVVGGYVAIAGVNSLPPANASFNFRTFYKWFRDTAIVLVNQHRDAVENPTQPQGAAKE